MELQTDLSKRKIIHSNINEVDFDHLEFGKHVSDHMFVCDYANEEWHTPLIVPFSNLSVSPATLALHYGQTVFEGMKAFRMQNGRINIFRIDKHYDRFAKSLERMCMATPPKDIFINGLINLVETDQAWVPAQKGTSLYLRPFMYASEVKFGIKISEQFRFIIFTGPVPDLFAKPIRVKVETNYIRAAKGGTGYAKCGGNYGAAFYPSLQAKQEGYDQVLWTDAKGNRFIEESGMMNIMFVINDILVTPPVSETILDGVTRDSLLTLAQHLGYKTEERPVSVDELMEAFRNNSIAEAFGAGTAAVVAPIQTIHINGIDYQLPAGGKGNVAETLKQKLEWIRTGLEEDVHNWNFVL